MNTPVGAAGSAAATADVIRLAVPDIDDDDVAAVEAVLRSGFLVQGPQVAAFEAATAEFVGTRHAVAVANCTAALHLTLLGLGVGPGDRVAVPTYSWPATANVVVLCGAEPVFVDLDPATWAMDPRRLAEVVDTTPGGLAAILPVHAFGGMADMAAIVEIAGARGIPVVEDAACALGAALGARQAGTWGVAGCFSFHPRKAVTTGEGGVIVTDDDRLARMARILRNHGLDPDASSPTFVAAGYNLRMTDLQAALGRTQLAKLDRIVARRRELAATYDRLVVDAGVGLTPPPVLADSVHVYQSYVTLLPAAAAPVRATLIERLRARGIETTIGTYHMPLIAFYAARGHLPGQFPVTDDVAGRALSLPLAGGMSDADQERVVASVADELRGLVTDLPG